MRPRTALLILIAMAGALLGATILILRLTEPDGAPVVAGPRVAPLEPAPSAPVPAQEVGPQTVTPPEVADPAAARRLEALIEARARYRSLRDGFTGPITEATRQRLDPALRALWPGRPAPYTVTCRGRVCQVEGPGAPESWRPQLLTSAAVAQVSDRVVVDPDGAEKPAYVLVSDGPAGSGVDLLADVERRLRESDEAARCIAGVGAGTVELEVLVDQTGITYRTGGTAQAGVIDCLGNALGSLAANTRVPEATQAATRTVTFELGR